MRNMQMTTARSEEDILILGAGPAGMAAAFELHKTGKKFTVVEKAEQVGGLAKTYQFGEFRTDNGPHRFFSKNKYLYDFIEHLLGEKWIKVDRFTRFYIDGKYYKYPIEWKNALSTMGIYKAGIVFFDYLLSRIKFYKKDPKNFEEYAVSKFGRALAEFNILNYTEKIWGLPCSQLSPEWADQRIQGLSVGSLLKNMLFKKPGPRTLVDQFYYPNLGTGLIYEEIKKKIEQKNRILLKTEPIKIINSNNQIKEIVLNTNDVYHPHSVITSIPITVFINLLDPKPPEKILLTAEKLKYRSQVYLFLTVNKPFISKDQWIYFPTTEVPFGRISEMKNFSDQMSPKDKTSLFIEFFCWKGDEVWAKSKEELFELTIKWLEKLSFVKRSEVVGVFHIKQEYVYPVYDLEYKEHLDIIKNYLDDFANLIYIGRPGRFKYTNQDHSLEMGMLAARSIIDGKRFDVEAVGAEQEYFEKGYVA